MFIALPRTINSSGIHRAHRIPEQWVTFPVSWDRTWKVAAGNVNFYFAMSMDRVSSRKKCLGGK